jgi:hypothetical protein
VAAAALAGNPQPATLKQFQTLEAVSMPPGITPAIVGRPRVSAAALEPGVYKTEPFACIVVVPGPQLDDPMIIQPPAGEFRMRTIVPDLRFIPLERER